MITEYVKIVAKYKIWRGGVCMNQYQIYFTRITSMSKSPKENVGENG